MQPESRTQSLFTLDPNRVYPILTHGNGVYVYDDQNRAYLDAAAGIAAVAAGYGRRQIAEAMAAQALKLPFVASNLFANEPAAVLAENIAALLPGHCNAVHFTSGGSEAVEVAIKISRQYFYDRGQPQKHLVIARQTSYHGATLGALSATGYAGRRKKFLPLLQDWPHIPPAYCYRCPFEKTYPQCGLACARVLEETILEAGPQNVMAFIAEPVVGAAALKKGLVTYPGGGLVDGNAGDIISLFPPLIFKRAHVDETVEKLDAAVAEVAAAPSP